jgi:hypothetical protein
MFYRRILVVGGSALIVVIAFGWSSVARRGRRDGDSLYTA